MRFTRRVTAAAIIVFLVACGKTSVPAQDSPALQTAAQSDSLRPPTPCGTSDGNPLSCVGGERTTLTYAALPAPYAKPWSFINGPDGALWFSEWNTDATSTYRGTDEAGIGRLIPGVAAVPPIIVSEKPLPDEIAPILGAFEDNGDLWFGDYGGPSSTSVGSFDVLRSGGGTVSAYPLVTLPFPGRGTNAAVRFSAATPDGDIWYAVLREDAIYRVAPEGSFTAFVLPNRPARPNDIVLGPDGALWFTEVIGNRIGRMTLDGTLTNVYAVPPKATPRFLAAGTDGALWFTENGSLAVSADNSSPPQIVRMTTSGAMTNFAMPPNSMPDSIRAAHGGFVFSDLGTNAVGFIDYSGNIVEYPIAYDGGADGNVQFSLQGSDGSLYFADQDLNRIGKINLDRNGMIFPQALKFPEPSPWGGMTNSQLIGIAVLANNGPFTAITDNADVATVSPVAGFPMNFIVTATGVGTTTLRVRSRGALMSASITVTAPPITTQSIRRGGTPAIHIL